MLYYRLNIYYIYIAHIEEMETEEEGRKVKRHFYGTLQYTPQRTNDIPEVTASA
jgi:hypothetical protein